jgi:tRNA A-37 threonylcarbamoyl transferase component Bud32
VGSTGATAAGGDALERAPAVGDVLDGRYQLLRDLGRGAAGAVYEARHVFTARFVAVKILLPQVRREEHEEMRIRLQREAQMLASIRHPGVVEVLDGGLTATGVAYVVLEMLEGRTLQGLLTARRTLSLGDTAGVGLQLCDALQVVHRAGVVHRDVKPANIIVLRDAAGDERIKLLDFGIAKVQDAEPDDKLTEAGVVLGTPAYMAPERLLGRGDDDARTDVYSVGATLFECLSGVMPYEGTYPEIVLRVATATPTTPLRSVAPDVPEALAAVVDRALCKSPMARFASAGDLAFAIEQAMPGAARTTTLLGPKARATAAATSGAQRRRRPRAPYSTPVRLMLANGVLDGRAEDISEGGVLVLSEATCSPGQRVALRFALPMEGKVVSVEADVRWVRAASGVDARGLRAIGLEFVAVPEPVRASVARYVELMAEHSPGP